MAKGRKTKKKLCPLVDNITDFSDMEYEDESNLSEFKSNKKVNSGYDDYDDSNLWDYDNYGDLEPEEDEDNLWEDNDEDKIEDEDNVSSEIINKNNSIEKNYLQKRIEFYMDAAFWFSNITEKGIPDKDETRYIELMIIELSKFYFPNIDKINPSEKCKEAILSILNSIQEADKICSDS